MELFPAESVMGIAFNDTVVVTTEQNAGQYYIVGNLSLGETYSFLSSNSGDYMSVRDVYDPSILIAHGPSPLSVDIPLGGPDLLAVHINLVSQPCGSDTLDRTTSLVCTTCPPLPPAIGVGVGYPKATLDVAGEVRLGDGPASTLAGMIRWNGDNADFEGYDGTKWKSLTQSNAAWGVIPSTIANETLRSTSSDGGTFDYFGYSVSMDGDFAIVGARFDDVGGNVNQGSAYIFKRNGSSWIEQAKLTASDGAANDLFGNVVSISGDFAIVGATSGDVGGNVNQGAAYIFKRNGSSWTEQAKQTASDGAAGDLFGTASIYGEYSIIGALEDDIAGNNNQGSAYVFKRNGSSWTEQAKLTASDGAANDNFGRITSILGNYAIVGAYRDDIGTNVDQGSAYVFRRDGTSWTEQAKLTASDGAAGDLFGESLALYEDYAIVGAQFDDVGANVDQGSAYIYKREGTSWTEQTKLIALDGSANDHFGKSVSITGDYAIVGAVNDDIGANVNQGSVYIFLRNGTSWTQQMKLIASDGAATDWFGFSVSISGDNLIVGAIGDTVEENGQQGSVYFFTRNQ